MNCIISPLSRLSKAAFGRNQIRDNGGRGWAEPLWERLTTSLRSEATAWQAGSPSKSKMFFAKLSYILTERST